MDDEDKKGLLDKLKKRRGTCIVKKSPPPQKQWCGTSMRVDPVRFIIDLETGVNAQVVKSDLEALADDLSINILEFKTLKMQLVTGNSTSGTYETLFNAELSYRERTIFNLNRMPSYVGEWVEDRKASVPKQFIGRIKRIYLQPKYYLSD